MNTTVDALKALYVVLGGNYDDVENISIIPDMIKAYESLDGLTAATTLSGVITKNNTTGDVTVSSTGDIRLHATDVTVQLGEAEETTLENYIKSVVQSVNQ